MRFVSRLRTDMYRTTAVPSHRIHLSVQSLLWVLSDLLYPSDQFLSWHCRVQSIQSDRSIPSVQSVLQGHVVQGVPYAQTVQ